MAIVLVELGIEGKIVLKLIDKRFQSIRQPIDAFLPFQEIPNVALHDCAQLLVSFKHHQQSVEIQMDWLEGLILKHLEDGIVDRTS